MVSTKRMCVPIVYETGHTNIFYALIHWWHYSLMWLEYNYLMPWFIIVQEPAHALYILLFTLQITGGKYA